MTGAKNNSRNPWAWIPTVYFAEGMPNALVATVSVLLYNDLGVSNAATAFFTSLLYLPWVIKPLWSPAVDILKTRRQWIWAMQLFMGVMLAGVALMIPVAAFHSMDDCIFRLAGVRLGDARHRGGRVLYARADGTRAGVFRRLAQHFF